MIQQFKQWTELFGREGYWQGIFEKGRRHQLIENDKQALEKIIQEKLTKV